VCRRALEVYDWIDERLVLDSLKRCDQRFDAGRST
jgi:hypothetical protein